MPIAFVTITPLGTATPSVSPYVVEVERVLRASGLKHQLTAMGTLVEGELEDLLAVVRRMHEAPFAAGALRVTTSIRIDDRRDRAHSIESKMRSMEEKLR